MVRLMTLDNDIISILDINILLFCWISFSFKRLWAHSNIFSLLWRWWFLWLTCPLKKEFKWPNGGLLNFSQFMGIGSVRNWYICQDTLSTRRDLWKSFQMNLSLIGIILRWVFLIWELIFIYCGLIVLILVVLFFFFFCVHNVSAKFHLWPSSGDLPWPRIGMLSLVTVFPVITAFHSCCLSRHVFFGARGAADRGVESLRFQVSIVRR